MFNYMPTKIYTGTNVLDKSESIFKQYGKKCYIISSKSAAKTSGALDDLLKIFSKYTVQYAIYDQVKPNPSVESCIQIGKLVYDYKADYIVGIGGGSVLDTCKAVAAIAKNPNFTEDELYEATDFEHLPFILIGTTAGTGAEVTKNAVLTRNDGTKRSIKGASLFADYAFGDYRYTASMPRDVRISTALDTLAHLMESYFSNKANPISRAYSIHGIRMLYPQLITLSQGKELNFTQQQVVYDASILGGLAINITGTIFCHAFGYYLTEAYHVPHGYACAFYENSLIDYELKNNDEYAKQFFHELSIQSEDLKKLINSLLPACTFKVSDDEFKSLIERYRNNSSVKNTYQDFDEDNIRRVLENILKK